MTERIYRWFAYEVGPRWPIVHIQRCEFFGWHWWTSPGHRHSRAEILLIGFIVALAVIS